MKYCRKCRINQPLSEFNKNSMKEDGLQTYCRPCGRKANNATYRRKADIGDTYYSKHSDKVKRYQKKYREENREEYKTLSAQRYASIKGRAIQLLLSARSRAKRDGLEFNLVIERIEFALLLGVCERTGVMFDLSPHSKYKHNPFAPSVDRIDSFRGYTFDNVKVVCNAYNFGKMQMTHDEYVMFCKAVVEFNK